MRTISRCGVTVALALAGCTVPPVTFTGIRDQVFEDCELAGDEDDNGAADCDDPACASEIGCVPPPPSCSDGMLNADETDVDCGGSCARCADGAACRAHGDCDAGLCVGDKCARLASCREIRAQGVVEDGSYAIDLDGAGGEPPFAVKCDMTIDGGGWTRFNWITGPSGYPASADPLELALAQCSVTDELCRGRIPATAMPADFMVKDLVDGDHALWHFEASNAVSQAAFRALRDKVPACVPNQATWTPYLYTGTEAFCGTGLEGGCDSFAYVDTTLGACSSYTGWHLQLDGDTSCYSAAFKLGMTHTGYETIGCSRPDHNFLDTGPADSDNDKFGELYYR